MRSVRPVAGIGALHFHVSGVRSVTGAARRVLRPIPRRLLHFSFFFSVAPFWGFWSISLPKVHLVQGHVFGGLFTATVSFDELDDLLRS